MGFGAFFGADETVATLELRLEGDRIVVSRLDRIGREFQQMGQRGENAMRRIRAEGNRTIPVLNRLERAGATITKALLSGVAITVLFGSIFAIINSLRRGFEFLVDQIREGLTAVGEFEERMLGLSAIIATSNRFSADSVTNLRQAQEVSRALQSELIIRNARILGDLNDATITLQTLIAQGAQPLVRNFGELVELTELFTNAILAVTPGQEKQRQLASETAAFLRGSQRATDVLARMLGVSASKLRTMREEALLNRNFLQQMQELMSGFNDIAGELGVTMTGLSTTFESIAQRLRLVLFSALFNRIRNDLINIRDFIENNFSDIALALSPVIAAFDIIFDRVRAIVKSIADAPIQRLEAIANRIANIILRVASIIEGVFRVIVKIASVIGDLLEGGFEQAMRNSPFFSFLIGLAGSATFGGILSDIGNMVPSVFGTDIGKALGAGGRVAPIALALGITPDQFPRIFKEQLSGIVTGVGGGLLSKMKEPEISAAVDELFGPERYMQTLEELWTDPTAIASRLREAITKVQPVTEETTNQILTAILSSAISAGKIALSQHEGRAEFGKFLDAVLGGLFGFTTETTVGGADAESFSTRVDALKNDLMEIFAVAKRGRDSLSIGTTPGIAQLIPSTEELLRRANLFTRLFRLQAEGVIGPGLEPFSFRDIVANASLIEDRINTLRTASEEMLNGWSMGAADAEEAVLKLQVALAALRQEAVEQSRPGAALQQALGRFENLFVQAREPKTVIEQVTADLVGGEVHPSLTELAGTKKATVPKTFGEGLKGGLKSVQEAFLNTAVAADIMGTSIASALTASITAGDNFAEALRRSIGNALISIGSLMVGYGLVSIIKGVFSGDPGAIGAGAVAVAKGTATIAVGHLMGGSGASLNNQGAVSTAAQQERLFSFEQSRVPVQQTQFLNAQTGELVTAATRLSNAAASLESIPEGSLVKKGEVIKNASDEAVSGRNNSDLRSFGAVLVSQS